MNILNKTILFIASLIFSTQHFHASCSEEFEQDSLLTQPKCRIDSQLSKDAITNLTFSIQAKIFLYCNIEDLGRFASVSNNWKATFDDPQLWRMAGLIKYGDYLTNEDLQENPKQKIVQHYLSVIVNTKENFNIIEKIVKKYNLDLYNPFFKKYIDPQIINFLIMEYERVKYPLALEELLAQGSKEAVKLKLRLELKKSGYDDYYTVSSRNFTNRIPGITDSYLVMDSIPGLTAFREANDKLVGIGDSEAIERKINGLQRGGCVVMPQRSMHVQFYNGFGYTRSIGAIKYLLKSFLKGVTYSLSRRK